MKNYLFSVLLPLVLGWCGVAAAQEAADSLAVPQGDAEPATVQQAADPADHELWDRANTAYINADYRTAIENYERILERGMASAKLYYNLANACFKSDRLGEAIVGYRRALRLAPGDEDIRYNLGVARARTKDNIEAIPEFFAKAWLRSLRHTMGCTAWSVVSLAALAVMLGCLLCYLLSQRIALRKAGFYGMLVAFAVCVATTWCALAERREMLDRDEAVVMVPSTAVKSSPDRSATDLFVLHEGTEVRVTGRLEPWCEIVIADGKKGWVEQHKIEAI